MSRADDLKQMLAAGRRQGESFKAYKKRRALANVAVEQALKGRVFYAPQFDRHGKGVPYRKAA